MFLLLDIKHKTYAKAKPQQQKIDPQKSVYANRLKINNVSILFNLFHQLKLVKQFSFSAFLKIQLQLNLTVVYLIDMLQPKLNNFRRLYLMQRYIADMRVLILIRI